MYTFLDTKFDIVRTLKMSMEKIIKNNFFQVISWKYIRSKWLRIISSNLKNSLGFYISVKYQMLKLREITRKNNARARLDLRIDQWGEWRQQV